MDAFFNVFSIMRAISRWILKERTLLFMYHENEHKEQDIRKACPAPKIRGQGSGMRMTLFIAA